MNCPRTSHPGSSQLPAKVCPGVGKPAFRRKVYNILSTSSDMTYCRFSSAAFAKSESSSRRTALKGKGCINGLLICAAPTPACNNTAAVINVSPQWSVMEMVRKGFTRRQQQMCSAGHPHATTWRLDYKRGMLCSWTVNRCSRGLAPRPCTQCTQCRAESSFDFERDHSCAQVAEQLLTGTYEDTLWSRNCDVGRLTLRQ